MGHCSVVCSVSKKWLHNLVFFIDHFQYTYFWIVATIVKEVFCKRSIIPTTINFTSCAEQKYFEDLPLYSTFQNLGHFNFHPPFD
jgi:hypothetical protein